MLFTGRLKIEDSREFGVLTGETISEEGIVLVQSSESGTEVVKPATGTSDVFIGFSYGQTFTPTVKSNVESLVVPAVSTYTVTLAREPISGQIKIFNNLGTEQTAGDPSTTANTYSISGKVITFHSGQAGKTETITYRYSPTAAEILATDRMQIPSVSATDQLMSIGAIQEGEIYTNMFDASVTFTFGMAVGMLSGGLVGAAGSNAIPGAIVCHVPTEDLPFLGIRF